VLDDNTLDPRNECCLLASWLSRDILEEVPCCCIEIVCLAEPVLEQIIIKVMVNRPCKCMPDVAQQLIDMLHFRVDSNLTNSVTKELIISPISKEAGVTIFY
jgi:hypothetical protein